MTKSDRPGTDVYLSSTPSHKADAAPLENVAPDDLLKRNSLKEKVIKPRRISQSTYENIYEELKSLNPDEHIIWIGRSSQSIHLIAYIVCALFCWLIFPVLIAYFLYLTTKHTIYVVTEERLRVYSGLFNKRIDDLELYRVKDSRYRQPLLLRFFGLSNIKLYTSDVTWGESEIPGVENGMILRERIRKIVEAAREKKGVREVDYFARGAGWPPNRN